MQGLRGHADAVVAPADSAGVQALVRWCYARKVVAGYALRSLLVGSEGTLGVVTGAWLRLIPAQEASLPVAAAYAGLGEGVRALGRVLGSGLVPAALEFFDAGCVAASMAAFPG